MIMKLNRIPYWSVVLAALACLTAFPVKAQFTITDGDLEGYDGPGGYVVIPDGVTAIGNYYIGVGGTSYENVFGGNVTGVTIPNSVIWIDSLAFHDCTLTSLTLGTNIEWIGQGCFFLDGPINITIPTNITTLGDSAFSGTIQNLTLCSINSNNQFISAYGDAGGLISPRAFMGLSCHLTIADNVNYIPDYVFYDATWVGDYQGDLTPCYQGFHITGLTIGNGCTSIGIFAFSENPEISDVTIGNNVISLGKGAFSGCESLTNVTIGTNVITIGDYAFQGFQGLSITIPNSVTTIGNYAFSPSALTSVSFGNRVTTIGTNAFAYCELLTSITVPASVTNIGGNTFDDKEPFGDGLASLTNISVAANNPSYASAGGVLFDKPLTTLFQYPAGATSTTYTVPNSVTSIGDFAFCHCSSLTSVTIPNSVTNLGQYAFGAGNLTNALFQGNAPTVNGALDWTVFWGGYQGTVYYYPWTSGWTNTFCNCPTVAIVPQVPVMIDEPVIQTAAIGGNATLASLAGGQGTLAYQWYFNGLPISGATGTNFVLSNLTTNNAGNYYVVITNAYGSVTSSVAVLTVIIPPPPFTFVTNNGAITITSYTGTNGVAVVPAMIDGYPVVDIASYAFEDYAVSGAAVISTISLPASVTNIESWAIDGCYSLTNISVDAANPAYASADGVLFDKAQANLLRYPSGLVGNYVVPTGCTAIAEDAFDYCSLSGIGFPNSLNVIGNWAFYQCWAITNLNLGANVAYVGNGAFYLCSDMTSITVGTNVTYIGNGVFAYDGSLAAINVLAGNLNYSTVGGVLFDKTQTTLLVYPGGAAQSYVIPNTVTTLGEGAFEGTSVTNITLGSHVQNIGDYAFDDCFRLNQMVIPGSVTNLGNWAFGLCHQLQNVLFTGNAPAADVFAFFGDSATAYYLPGTSGWTNTIGGIPAVALSSSGLAFGQQPTNTAALLGDSATFSVSAFSLTPFNYYWQSNNVPISGANQSSLTISNVTLAGSGSFFSCLISNVNGTLQSSNAVLTVIVPPANDQCSGAFVVSGNSYTNTESTALATSTGDPSSPSILGNGVWYAFTPANSGTVSANTIGSSFDTVLAMYSGTCGTMTLVTYNDDSGGYLTSSLTNAASGGTTYYFLAGGYGGATGNLVFHLNFQANQPVIQRNDGSFGIQNNGFGFNFSGAVVEASTNLINWTPVFTNASGTGSVYFSDPQWTNFPGRFYRVRSQ